MFSSHDDAQVFELLTDGSQIQVTVSGIAGLTGLAVDAAGNVFLVDSTHVVEMSARGFQQTLPFSGLHNPIGVAVDAAGNVYVADTGNNRVLELPLGFDSVVGLPVYGPQRTLAFTGLAGPRGLMVECAGDVFVADSLNGRVVELLPGRPQQTLSFSGLLNPGAVAIDAAGNTFCLGHWPQPRDRAGRGRFAADTTVHGPVWANRGSRGHGREHHCG